MMEATEGFYTDNPSGDYYDLEHDDHASCHVIKEESLFALIERTTSAGIKGVYPGMILPASGRGSLLYDMGAALLVKTVERNLISEIELLRNYRVSLWAEDIKVYEHRKKAGHTLTFRRDSRRFGDAYLHCLIPKHRNLDEAYASDFYNPDPLLPFPKDPSGKLRIQMERAIALHHTLNHMSPKNMLKLIDDFPDSYNATDRGVKLMVKHHECEACGRGMMAEHSLLPSSRLGSEAVGEAVAADIFYIEYSDKLKIPVLLCACKASLFMVSYTFLKSIHRKRNKLICTEEDVREGLTHMLAVWRDAGRECKTLRFDREPGVMTNGIATWLLSEGVTLLPTAAAQHVALIEALGRNCKDRGRSTLAGIQGAYGYEFPRRFVTKLHADMVSLLNRLPRPGENRSPYYKFYGKSGLDVRRDLRIGMGELLLFKRPKHGVASPMTEYKAEWGLVVGRSYNATGVVEVYLVESGAIGHRFKFVRNVVAPTYIKEIVKNIGTAHIKVPVTVEIGQAIPAVEQGTEDIGVEDLEAEDIPAEVFAAQVSYSQALRTCPERAGEAMLEEMSSFLNKGLFHPVHNSSIKPCDKKYILRALDGYKEKYDSDGTFEKSKARVFVDGSGQKQEYVGASSSPVARVESVMVLCCIAALFGWIVYKIDIVGAYLNTPRPPEVKYKYLRLPKHVVKVLLVLRPEFAEYVEADGTMLVELDHMLYGMKEAGYEWHKLLFTFLKSVGFVVNDADSCVIHRSSDRGETHGVVTVDDMLFVSSTEDEKIRTIADIAERFGDKGYTVAEGNDIPHLGMMLKFDRVAKLVRVSQKKFVEDLRIEAGVCDIPPARKPANEFLFERPESILLETKEKDRYRSLCMSLLYASTRTYPECLPIVTVLAGRFIDATEHDMNELLTAISYLGYDAEHCLCLRPSSLNPIASGDSSYAVHVDGKSHGGIALGFEGSAGAHDCYIAFSSGKEARVAKSSCEAELMTANRAADSLLWMTRLLSGFGIRHGKPRLLLKSNGEQENFGISVPVLYQDNKSSIHIAEHGKGNFKNTKHIRVRYYYISDMIRSGELLIKWIPTDRMVADILTKGVSLAVFMVLLPLLLGKSID